MSQELNQDKLKALADLLVISEKAKAREALCIRIGIKYYNEFNFMYETSDSSFAINLINHLNEVDNTGRRKSSSRLTVISRQNYPRSRY